MDDINTCTCKLRRLKSKSKKEETREEIMRKEYKRYIQHTFRDMGRGMLYGALFAVAFRKTKMGLHKCVGAGMGIGAGYALYEAQ